MSIFIIKMVQIYNIQIYSIDFRVESSQGALSDDGAGIGVRLTCEYPWSSTEYVYEYRTYSGDPAGWGDWYGMDGGSCGNGWAVGYRTNTETGGCNGDCTGVNCIQLLCSDGTILTPEDCRGIAYMLYLY